MKKWSTTSLPIILVIFGSLLTISQPAGITAELARNIDGRSNQRCVPTGVCLDPAGHSFDVGNMPLAVTLSPEGDRLILSLSGWRQQGLQVVDWKTGQVLQTLPQA